MDNTLKIIIIVALLGVAYYLYSKDKGAGDSGSGGFGLGASFGGGYNNNSSGGSGGGNHTGGGSGNNSSSCDRNKILKKGVRGNEVKVLQSWLNNNIPAATLPLVADGVFGNKTLNALRQVTFGMGSQMDQVTLNRLNIQC